MNDKGWIQARFQIFQRSQAYSLNAIDVPSAAGKGTEPNSKPSKGTDRARFFLCMHTPRSQVGIIAVPAFRAFGFWWRAQFSQPQTDDHGEKTKGADHYSIDGASADRRHHRVAAIEDHHRASMPERSVSRLPLFEACKRCRVGNACVVQHATSWITVISDGAPNRFGGPQ